MHVSCLKSGFHAVVVRNRLVHLKWRVGFCRSFFVWGPSRCIFLMSVLVGGDRETLGVLCRGKAYCGSLARVFAFLESWLVIADAGISWSIFFKRADWVSIVSLSFCYRLRIRPIFRRWTSTLIASLTVRYWRSSHVSAYRGHSTCILFLWIKALQISLLELIISRGYLLSVAQLWIPCSSCTCEEVLIAFTCRLL